MICRLGIVYWYPIHLTGFNNTPLPPKTYFQKELMELKKSLFKFWSFDKLSFRHFASPRNKQNRSQVSSLSQFSIEYPSCNDSLILISSCSHQSVIVSLQLFLNRLGYKPKEFHIKLHLTIKLFHLKETVYFCDL